MYEGQTSQEVKPGPLPTRRSLLKAGGALALGAGAVALAACTSNAPGGATDPTAAAESALDRWVRDKQALFGIDLSFPPFGFKDSNGKPAGVQVEQMQALANSAGVKAVFVDTPFDQLIAACVAGKFDVGEPLTPIPTRSLKVQFADFPCFYEGNLAVLKPSSTVTQPSQLNDSNVKIAIEQGSAQEYSTRLLFPKAQIVSLTTITDMANEVDTGRADAMVVGDGATQQALKAHPNLKILPTGALFVDSDTFWCRLGDYKLTSYMTNFLRYECGHGLLTEIWDRYVGQSALKLGVPVTYVGTGGEGRTVNPDGKVSVL